MPWHPQNILAKQPKTTTPRLHATYPVLLNCQTFLKRILKNISLDTSKAAGMDPIQVKLQRDGFGVVKVLPVPLRNIINLSIKYNKFINKTIDHPRVMLNCLIKTYIQKRSKDWSQSHHQLQVSRDIGLATQVPVHIMRFDI